ncbi:hypothetical protein Vadar_001877 [Vaccinium darrowii]|uniref:Uncharacterized protein n=1 Tax=Vaccinium darrowii TaxID=229202 RepID=A0ACB7XNP1_9ERIC|nr:hypothetical protein Vadar_001877 [Vaccinium darrowii]
MSSSRLLSLFYLLSFSLFLKLALAQSPVAYQCSSPTTFSPNGNFSQNLNNLMNYLDAQTPLTGFGNGTVGQNLNQVYGLALCRGDINTTDCQACVTEAINEVQNICPLKTEAFIWYNYCQFKYSNLNFLGQIDHTEWYYQKNPVNASNPVYFNAQVKDLFTNLESQAVASPKLYANGTLAIANSTTLYGLAQCTRDLSSTNCQSCIGIAIDIFQYGGEGGKIMGGSCNIRFEIYPFLNS